MSGLQIVNGLAGLLIVTSLLVVVARKPSQSAKFYALQSLVLVAVFVALGSATNAPQLYVWAAVAFVTKVVLVPVIMARSFGRLSDERLGSGERISPAVTVLLAAVVVLLCTLIISGVTLPAAAGIKPALAISLAHFFFGLACIVTQRNILKQVFGYCLMENGSHLTLALLAGSAPELVEIGITTDAVFAVVIMVILATQINRKLATLDADQLTTLKG
ncbi:hydrogenase-4 component E [Rhodopseudomonas rhenobacensis]|uniref:Hydrogenase-4 component E n=1 Tax=Rhodopseudomonas rhenobacensis TaxID=87461 RepID=A0A7W7Z1T2_9BRAD|nr:hydrogenase 4 membrane subunit [Rhodopseudomonas rhenobacensis]MBB5046230.1 hydrogenase-4 component E [Rhodopseudomonas rhenobacensis]